jgi:uncharacterized protein (DUF58 family)
VARSRWPRRLQFTREGKYFVGITFGVGFAAINTGNNLLYLLFGMLLSFIIASGILSELSLRDLEVSRQIPTRMHSKRPFLVGISLKNNKRRLPSFSVEVEDLYDDKPIDKRCYFLKLPSARSQSTSYRHTFARRGRYVVTGFRISTKFPFGLFRKSRTVDSPGELIVYPELVPIRRGRPPASRNDGDEIRGRAGRRGEFHGLREHREGDDPRDIHWPSTARRGRWMVREYEDEAARRLTIFLDNGLDENPTEAELDALERGVSLAASMTVDYLQRGFAVRVCTRSNIAPPWLRGTGQAAPVLRALALLPSVSRDVPFPLKAEGRAARGGKGRVVEA